MGGGGAVRTEIQKYPYVRNGIMQQSSQPGILLEEGNAGTASLAHAQ